MKNRYIRQSILLLLVSIFGMTSLLASSHREAPLIANDPLADNVDVYAFRSPDNPDMVTIIATYVPFQIPHGGPNYFTFGENVRYEIHVDNDAAVPGDEVTYRFTFSIENEDPTTFFNIRLGKQNQKATYVMERSFDGGQTFETVISDGVVPANNIGDRSISSPVGLGTTYSDLWTSAITQSTGGELVFAGPADDPFFVDLGGIFDLGDAPRQDGTPADGLACHNVSAIAIQVPIATLLKSGSPTVPENILDPNYVIGVWASASRPAMTTLSSNADPSYSGDWIQVSRLGMPLTNEAVIPIGAKDFWNSISPYDEISETTLDEYFYNPELALYMDDEEFGGAVPAFGPLRIQKASLGMFDFSNGADGVSALKGTDLTGTAFELYGDLLLIPGKPRSVDLWPIFHTGVPNAIPYQLATGKGGNPLAAGKPFINNFLPNGGDMLRLNMAVPPTPRDDPNFSSLGLVQAAAIGLTVAPFNTTADLEFIPNMDGFPNGRRLEDDVTRIELQAVGGVVLAAIGLWYDDYDPANSPSPVTQDLLDVLTYSTGVEKNDKDFGTSFPYIAQPHSGTGDCGGEIYTGPANPNPAVVNLFVSSNTSGQTGVIGIDETLDISLKTYANQGIDADGIYYDSQEDVVYQLNRSDHVVHAYSNVKQNLESGNDPVLTATSTSDFINGREIAIRANKLVVAQDANQANGMTNKFVVYDFSPTNITFDRELTTSINLWGIQFVGSDLLAIEDNSSNLAVFSGFLSNSGGNVDPSRSIMVEDMVRTHGLTVDQTNNILILTDVGEASSPVDGAIVIVEDYINAMADGVISSDEQIRISGPMSTLGNPVDVALDYINNWVFVAERANGGGQILAFDFDASDGDIAPAYSRDFSGASAIHFSDLMDDREDLNIISRFFTSSNNDSAIGVYATLEDLSIEMSSFDAPMDADGIHYDSQMDVLYQLDRTNNVINAYSNVVASLEAGQQPTITATSTSNFANGREIAVMGDKLIVAQDASADNNMINKLVVYEVSPSEITFVNDYIVDINLWGIHAEKNNFYAIVDNSNLLAVYSNLCDNPPGMVSPDRTIYIENLVRTHGITYAVDQDLMLLTDVGAAGSPDDGAIVVVSNFSAKASDDTLSMQEQVRIEGPMSLLGNPVDLALDRDLERIYVAERANGGGRILGFDIPSNSGDVSPDFDMLQSGASAIHFPFRVNEVDRPQIDIFDPNFSDDFLVSARMSGGNEVPSVTTDAIGVATVTFNRDYTKALLNATVSNLSSNFTGAHIHRSFPGSNGPVVFNVTSEYEEGRITAELDLTDEDVSKFIEGEYYLNVHTEDFPNGELRGNLALEAAHSFIALVDGDQEVPSVNTAAQGILSMHYTSNTNILEVNFLASGLSGPITGIHLHLGEEGENGPVVENLTPHLEGNSISVKLDAGDYIQALRNDSIYLNVHTAANPSGEIRGDVFGLDGLVYDAWMTPSQEVPVVDNSSFGLLIGQITPNLDVINVAALVDGLSGEITGAHLHEGALGQNGGVAINLTDFIENNLIVNDDDIDLSLRNLELFLSGQLYINVHTERHPGGELRGQVYKIARDGYAYDLCQSQEVMPVVDAGIASGSGMLAFNRDYDEMHMMVVVNELSSDFQGAHIHNAPAGQNGAVVFDLTDRWNNSGSFFYVTDEFSSELASQIQAGEAYVNVHTLNNQPGEVRGQIVKTPDCPFSTATVNTPSYDLEVGLYPNPAMDVINVQIDGFDQINGETILRILHVDGREISNQVVNREITSIEIQQLSSGNYFMSLSNDEFTHTMKFTKSMN